MYVPDKFAVGEERVRAWLRDAGLAHLVTAGPEGLDSTPMPFVYVEDGDGWGRLVGHMARVNPQWRAAADAADGTAALVIVPGTNHYVTPRWRPSSRLHGRAMPTWDYEALNVHGRLVVHDDPAWIEQQVRDLAAHHEPQHGSDWELDEAPRPYAAGLLRAAVGVEVVIESVTGKMKMGQDRTLPDQVEVEARLREEGRDDSADAVAEASAIAEARRAAREQRVAAVKEFRAAQEDQQ